MPEIDILHQMIKETAKIPLEQDDYGKLVAKLTEPQCPDSCITIHKMPERAIIISLDACWSLEGMFTHKKGQCKRADFVIIADTGTQKVIVYIEMKRTHAKRNAVIQQLTGAQCFIAYCRELARARAFWNQPDFLQEYEERFVYLGQTNISIDKRPTRIDPKEGVHDRPEKLLKLNAPHYVALGRLVGRRP